VTPLTPGEADQIQASLQIDLKRIEKTIRDVTEANETPGVHRAPALAQYLSQFYTGLESSWEKALKLANQDIPDKGGQYHRKLLTCVIEAKLVPAQHIDFLDDLMSFRHFARHGYGTDYRIDEVREKAANAKQVWPDLMNHLKERLCRNA
jgi:hypothetical protein